MATNSIYTKIKLNKKETERFKEIMRADSPCKDVCPASSEKMNKGEAELKAWLSH